MTDETTRRRWDAYLRNGNDPAGEPLDPLAHIISAAELATKDFPDPRWAVPGVVPDGATVLAGAPKKGKSWLLLGLGLAIAAGGYAMGKIPVEQGDVLLLCLEDNQRRLQERMARVLDGEPAPQRLKLVTEWPRLNEGAACHVEKWLRAHAEARLVGIDVLARLRPLDAAEGNLYQRDYSTLSEIKAVADAHGVALVVVHHTRKMTADDPLDTVSGTQGLAAAADTTLVLRREKKQPNMGLYVRGRDVPEADYAISLDPVTCQWTLLGDASDFQVSAGRREILALLRDRMFLTPAEIAEALSANRGTVRSLLMRMRNAGQIVETDGRYSAAPLLHPATGATGATAGENSA